jgi:arylsulfatase
MLNRLQPRGISFIENLWRDNPSRLSELLAGVFPYKEIAGKMGVSYLPFINQRNPFANGSMFASLGIHGALSENFRMLLVVMLGMLFASRVSAAAPRAATDRPNLIVVLLDDAGYGDFPLAGNPTTRTPNLERMAREGLRFAQFYCGSAACTASRFALLTGRNARRSGLGKWVISPDDARFLHQNEITIADGLRQRGYKTAIFGKWHLGTPNETNGFNTNAFPLAHGFDKYCGLNASADYPDVKLYEGPSAAPNFACVYHLMDSNVRSNAQLQSGFTRRFTDETIRFMRENREKPFYIYLAYTLPHLPLYPNKEFAGKSLRGTYGDIMEELDASLGRVLDAVNQEGLEQNTLVVFTSDNGPWIFWRKDRNERLNVGDSGPFRDGKGSGWEGGVRVPGIFWWPGTIAPGTVVSQPASTLDLLPTIFRLAGEPLPQDRTIDGRDVSPLLAPKIFSGVVPAFTFFYTDEHNAVSGVRKGAWKLHTKIYTQTGDNYGHSSVTFKNPLLFQVEHDFGERFNVASEELAKVRELQNDITAFNRQADAEGTFWDRGSQSKHSAHEPKKAN